ncbi:MAG: glycerate kinase [Prevotella sp.]|nr:glycerate kinase [Prevotella sp.]
MNNIIVAIDSFKGCLTSKEANRAAAEGVRQGMADAEVRQVAVSDGGEGWLDAFQEAWGGDLVDVRVSDPLGRLVMAQYLKKDDRAVVEIVSTCSMRGSHGWCASTPTVSPSKKP